MQADHASQAAPTAFNLEGVAFVEEIRTDKRTGIPVYCLLGAKDGQAKASLAVVTFADDAATLEEMRCVAISKVLLALKAG